MAFAAMSYLGSVTANTRAKTDEVLAALQTAQGKSLTHTWGMGGGEHATGRAVDFMVFQDGAAGDMIAGYLIANASRLGVAWIIWQQRIWNVGAGGYGAARVWNRMEDRGNSTQNHIDHVHVLFGSDSYGPQTTWEEGDTGDKVAEIQRLVSADPDGDWGPKTTAAVKAWQTRNGLDPDGIWGPDCEATVKRLATPKPTPTPTPAPTPTPTPGAPMTIEEQIADNTLRAADALTVGKEGVKYDGDVIALLREHTAALTEQTAILRELRDLAKAALGPKPTAAAKAAK